jgi:hypothetical protein
MWKEMVVAQFEVLPRNFPRTIKRRKPVVRTANVGRVFNPERPEYNATLGDVM